MELRIVSKVEGIDNNILQPGKDFLPGVLTRKRSIAS